MSQPDQAHGAPGDRQTRPRQTHPEPLAGGRNVRPGRGRLWLFRAWVALTVAVALYVAFADPFALGNEVPSSYLAYSVPPLMILLLGVSLAWLASLVWRGDRRRGRSREGK